MFTIEEAKKCIKDTSAEKVGRYYYITRGKDPDYSLRPFYCVMCTGDEYRPTLRKMWATVADKNECHVVKCTAKGKYEFVC